MDKRGDTIDLIIDVLMDKAARVDEKDDAAMELANYPSDKALRALIKVGSKTDEDEYFYLSIKNGDKTICQRSWNAKLYPPKVRYTLYIRPRVKNILKDLTDIFSEKNLSYEYMDYNL